MLPVVPFVMAMSRYGYQSSLCIVALNKMKSTYMARTNGAASSFESNRLVHICRIRVLELDRAPKYGFPHVFVGMSRVVAI